MVDIGCETEGKRQCMCVVYELMYSSIFIGWETLPRLRARGAAFAARAAPREVEITKRKNNLAWKSQMRKNNVLSVVKYYAWWGEISAKRQNVTASYVRDDKYMVNHVGCFTFTIDDNNTHHALVGLDSLKCFFYFRLQDRK